MCTFVLNCSWPILSYPQTHKTVILFRIHFFLHYHIIIIIIIVVISDVIINETKWNETKQQISSLPVIRFPPARIRSVQDDYIYNLQSVVYKRQKLCCQESTKTPSEEKQTWKFPWSFLYSLYFVFLIMKKNYLHNHPNTVMMYSLPMLPYWSLHCLFSPCMLKVSITRPTVPPPLQQHQLQHQHQLPHHLTVVVTIIIKIEFYYTQQGLYSRRRLIRGNRSSWLRFSCSWWWSCNISRRIIANTNINPQLKDSGVRRRRRC